MFTVFDRSALTRFDTIGHHSATSRHHKLQAALPGARMHDVCVEQLLGHLGDKMRKTMQTDPDASENSWAKQTTISIHKFLKIAKNPLEGNIRQPFRQELSGAQYPLN